ncbi:CRISPR system precrRNA processing endoribonuclease RAMP protein Cas6 [Nocardia abscessus]|uniref:CRISPR system precrRNA processing endoribonuclease RAMP protein Cas6 n=1 Tax=Nocardia abscessus TaxID=120957 RepID=UPI002456D0DB|nr:CRISPR system precrRNA processing endoribonuclease RAMP protein Cas6 [Nocardia abscessus]
MITRWALPLAGIDPTRVSLTHLHAVASRLADQHHWSSPKPWSARPPRFLDGLCVLEIITLTSEAAHHLHTTATPGTPVRFGPQHGTILTSPHPLATTTWHELHTATPTEPVWTVHFRTPATFGNRDRFSPWPDPSAVARSLTNRWNTLNPDPTQHLDQDPRTWHRIWVSDIHAHTELLPLPGLTVPGILGHIRYHCEDPDTAHTLHRLLLLAEHAGLGRYTTRGLGIITLTQPAPTGDPKHTGAGGRTPTPRRSVHTAHQHKQPKTTGKGTFSKIARRRSVQSSDNIADQTG